MCLSARLEFSPIFPCVLLSLRTPNAMVGKMQAKYRKNIVDIVLWIVLRPTNPAEERKSIAFKLHTVLFL